jgi:hypothetical protein
VSAGLPPTPEVVTVAAALLLLVAAVALELELAPPIPTLDELPVDMLPDELASVEVAPDEAVEVSPDPLDVLPCPTLGPWPEVSPPLPARVLVVLPLLLLPPQAAAATGATIAKIIARERAKWEQAIETSTFKKR